MPDAHAAVSVVIPTYNRRALLRRAIVSVLAQTRPANEIIVVDDGSTDGTAAMAAHNLPRVRYLRQGNRGVSAARNAGIRAAAGTWIAFLDDDDEWLPDKLRLQLEALRDVPDAVLCHTEETWIRGGRCRRPPAKYRKHGGHIFRHCLPVCAICPSSAVVRRDIFATVGLFDEDLPACEDYDLWLRVCARYPVVLVDRPLVRKHGGHADQLSHRHPAMDRFRIRALEKILAAGILAPPDHAAAVEVLTTKARIVSQGAARRGQTDVAATYAAKAARAFG